jgi:hypothetical protein
MATCGVVKVAGDAGHLFTRAYFDTKEMLNKVYHPAV